MMAAATVPSSLRVLHVVDTLGVGGAETWLMALLRYWHRQGLEAPRTDIVAMSGNEGHFDAEARALGARIFYLRFGRTHLAAFVRRWRRILREGRYAAIHDHQEFGSGWHFLAGAGLLPPVRITHVHNAVLGYKANYGVTPSRRLAAAAGWRLVNAFATHVCGTSGALLREYGYVPGRPGRPQAEVVHCGFDVGTFNGPREADRASVRDEFGWPAEARIVLSVGRIDRALEVGHPQNHKNSWFGVQVARLAARQDARVRYLVAGDGGGREAMARAVAGWGLADRLRFAGVRDDVPRLMRAADVLLFPSVEEGLGMVAVEAQAAGLPVLASTAVPREAIVVPALYHALSLAEPVGAWAAAVARIMSAARPTAADCRRAVAESGFSIRASAQRLAAIYASLCGC